MYGPHITASESWVVLGKFEEHCQRLEVRSEVLGLGIAEEGQQKDFGKGRKRARLDCRMGICPLE